MTDFAEGAPSQNSTSEARPLYIIAQDIRNNWPSPYFGAFPYIHAMRALDRITDSYGADSGTSIVAYFLSNARTWQGPEARRIKTELKTMLKGAGYV